MKTCGRAHPLPSPRDIRLRVSFPAHIGKELNAFTGVHILLQNHFCRLFRLPCPIISCLLLSVCIPDAKNVWICSSSAGIRPDITVLCQMKAESVGFSGRKHRSSPHGSQNSRPDLFLRHMSCFPLYRVRLLQAALGILLFFPLFPAGRHAFQDLIQPGIVRPAILPYPDPVPLQDSPDSPSRFSAPGCQDLLSRLAEFYGRHKSGHGIRYLASCCPAADHDQSVRKSFHLSQSVRCIKADRGVLFCRKQNRLRNHGG